MINAGGFNLSQSFLGVFERGTVDMDQEQLGALRGGERLEFSNFRRCVVANTPNQDMIWSAEIFASQSRSNPWLFSWSVITTRSSIHGPDSNQPLPTPVIKTTTGFVMLELIEFVAMFNGQIEFKDSLKSRLSVEASD